MNFSRHPARLLTKSIIGFVYLVFFAVQFLFNFDAQGNSHIAFKSASHKTANFDNWEGKQHHPSVFRLNKRFQPAFTPAIAAFEIMPVREFSERPGSRYISPSITPPANLCRSLRAPPAHLI